MPGKRRWSYLRQSFSLGAAAGLRPLSARLSKPCADRDRCKASSQAQRAVLSLFKPVRIVYS